MKLSQERLYMLLGLPKPVFGFHRAQEVSYAAVGVHWLVAWTEDTEVPITLDKSWLFCWIWMNLYGLYDRNANWCWLELWLPHTPLSGEQARQAGRLGRGNPAFLACRKNWGMIYYAFQLCAQRMLFLVSSQLRMCSDSSKKGDSRLNLSRAVPGLLSSCLTAPSCNRACVCRCQAWKEQSLACKIEGNSWWKPKRRKKKSPEFVLIATVLKEKKKISACVWMQEERIWICFGGHEY